MNPKQKDIMYTLNKYADINPSEIQEHFALNLSTYDTHEVYKGPIIRNSHKILRTIHEPTPESEDLESLELYDLDDSKNLFKRYLTAFGKNITTRYGRAVHFYKFVKSLVDVNREHYNGNKTTEINEKSDVVEHPTDYYY
ncbi:unnamed protein product [Diatraea saccharalis]|uniref:Uncharacterized protein n=1 Tax=Diatraea saccharalis TaxID=40085 RepID=A0A9N9W945_9NEOP|nr:unnamed protein product [Diatraea saccharalis]